MCDNLSVPFIKIVLGLKLFPQPVVKKDVILGGSLHWESPFFATV